MAAMKPMMTQVKDNAGLLSILAGLLVVAGSFSHLEKLAWLIQVPNVAYAGQAVAEDTKDKFERYLERQEAFTEALQEYTQQQQQPMQYQQAPNQMPQPEFFIEPDDAGRWWCCGAYTNDQCWKLDLWYRCDQSGEAI